MAATLNSNFVNTGIKSVSYNATLKRLSVITQLSPVGALRIRPIFYAGLTNERLANVSAKAGQYEETTGEFFVKFNDGPSDFIDITSLLAEGESIYCWVRAGGL